MRYSKIALRRGYRPQARAIGSAGERLVHTEEVTGSIPVSPTRSETKIEQSKIALRHGCPTSSVVPPSYSNAISSPLASPLVSTAPGGSPGLPGRRGAE